MLTNLKLPYYKRLAEKLIKKYAHKRKDLEDRDILERTIFPYVLASFNPKKILDIGREGDQEFYNEFFRGRELWTIDIDPAQYEFGSIHHITDDAANLKKYFKNNNFDFILMNKIFGYGLNNKNKAELIFNSIYDILKPEGIFILGYREDSVKLNEIKSVKKFKPFCFQPLEKDCYYCSLCAHIYRFYTK